MNFGNKSKILIIHNANPDFIIGIISGVGEGQYTGVDFKGFEKS
jgi:hypothetical protein